MISDKTETNLLYHKSTQYSSRIYNVIINSSDRPDSGGRGLGFYLKNILEKDKMAHEWY